MRLPEPGVVEAMDVLPLIEMLFWSAALVVLGLVLRSISKQDREIPRAPILATAVFFLCGHLFFDSLESYLDLPAPRSLLALDFLARVGIEVLESAGFFFLILISLRVAEARRTIRKQHLELALANQQLLQASKLASIGELATGLGHEINNPLGILLARTDYMLAAANPEIPAEWREDLNVVRGQAERISETVRGLLTFARPSALRVQRVSLGDVVGESLQLESPRCRNNRIAVEEHFQAGLPAIQADPDRLQQVLVNILNNAIDAMPRGGKLTVSTGVNSPRSVFVQVSDTGVGIPDEDLLKIFDPFFTTKPAGKGTGLGLAVSYGIVRNHGGEIHVESAVGKGSTFTIVLPTEDNHHAAGANSSR